MYNLEGIILTCIIVFIASTVQGMTGFGFALIAVPVLTLIFPIQMVVPMIVCYCIVINTIIVLPVKKLVKIKRIWVLILFGIIGIPFGVFVLKNINSEYLKALIGVVIVIASIIMFKGYKVNFKREQLSYGIAGFISGVLNGGLSMSGPPIVLFLSNQGYDKDEFRGNLAFNGVVTNNVAVLIFIYNDLLSADMISVIGINLIVLVVGTYLGIKISKRIHEDHFKKIVLLLLGIVGVATIIKSFGI